jgi:FKBP-type peptidyl-prolyl cis-trans isomerase
MNGLRHKKVYLMKRLLFKITVVIFITTVIFSCTDSKNKGFKIADNGVKYKVHYLGDDNTKASESEIVTVNLAYRLEDSVIFNSSTSDDGPMRFPITKSLFKGDLYDALKLMGTGDSMTIEVVADSFYLVTAALPKLPESVEKGSKLYYDIKLLKHLTSDEWKLEMADLSRENARNEKIYLQNYLVDNSIDAAPTKTGLYFIPIEKGKGAKPDTGDMCQVFLSVKELGNDQLLYSNFEDRAIDVEYGNEFDTEGFREGLGMLRPGGKATLIVPSWIGVGSAGREVVAPHTTLIYEVKLQAIRSLEEVKKDRAQHKKDKEAEKERLKEEEPSKIANYVKKNNISVEPTESGLYLIETVEGKGENPVDSNTVTIQYIHYDLDGNVLQSSYEDETPFTYVVGTGAVIKGWEEAVKLMRKGSKSWMLMPSSIGYGDYQRTKEVKPYSPLVFELELIEVKK